MWYCQLSYSVCRRTLVIDFLNCACHYQRGNEPWCGLPLVTEESIHQQDANIWYHGWHREIRSPWQLQSGQPEMKIYKLQPAPSQFSVNQIQFNHFYWTHYKWRFNKTQKLFDTSTIAAGLKWYFNLWRKLQ